jgi:hypothetical protein
VIDCRWNGDEMFQALALERPAATALQRLKRLQRAFQG